MPVDFKRQCRLCAQALERTQRRVFAAQLHQRRVQRRNAVAELAQQLRARTVRAQMLDDMKPQGVVVWDTSEDTEASLWGGVMTATAKSKQIRGAVIAGGIRDTKQILEQNFPVFYKYRTSNGSLGRCMITHYQVPVRIGKVTVRPGDIIFGDIDGVLCIPREIAYQVLLRAEGIERNEVDIFSWVHQGDSISEIIAKGGYF